MREAVAVVQGEPVGEPPVGVHVPLPRPLAEAQGVAEAVAQGERVAPPPEALTRDEAVGEGGGEALRALVAVPAPPLAEAEGQGLPVAERTALLVAANTGVGVAQAVGEGKVVPLPCGVALPEGEALPLALVAGVPVAPLAVGASEPLPLAVSEAMAEQEALAQPLALGVREAPGEAVSVPPEGEGEPTGEALPTSPGVALPAAGEGVADTDGEVKALPLTVVDGEKDGEPLGEGAEDDEVVAASVPTGVAERREEGDSEPLVEALWLAEALPEGAPLEALPQGEGVPVGGAERVGAPALPDTEGEGEAERVAAATVAVGAPTLPVPECEPPPDAVPHPLALGEPLLLREAGNVADWEPEGVGEGVAHTLAAAEGEGGGLSERGGEALGAGLREGEGPPLTVAGGLRLSPAEAEAEAHADTEGVAEGVVLPLAERETVAHAVPLALAEGLIDETGDAEGGLLALASALALALRLGDAEGVKLALEQRVAEGLRESRRDAEAHAEGEGVPGTLLPVALRDGEVRGDGEGGAVARLFVSSLRW
jgi:hypothetical protein